MWPGNNSSCSAPEPRTSGSESRQQAAAEAEIVLVLEVIPNTPHRMPIDGTLSAGTTSGFTGPSAAEVVVLAVEANGEAGKSSENESLCWTMILARTPPCPICKAKRQVKTAMTNVVLFTLILGKT